MTLQELTHKQQVALVALVEAVTISDGAVSEGESDEINLLVDAFGEDSFRALLDEAESLFENREDLQCFLETIDEKEACELIFGTVMAEVISSPSVDGGPSDLLEWLAATWCIDIAEQE